MKDYILMRSGYDCAINDVLKLISDDLLRDKIIRLKMKQTLINEEYYGTKIKCYDKPSNTGYVIFKDIYSTQGYSINCETKNKTMLTAQELEFTLMALEGSVVKEYSDVEEFELELGQAME